MNRFSKNTISFQSVVAGQCDMQFSKMQFLKIDLETNLLHIIECRGPLLFCTEYIIDKKALWSLYLFYMSQNKSCLVLSCHTIYKFK